jgi:uncharacterized protein (DUF1778 family)
MAKRKQRAKILKGSNRMKQLGKRPIQIWVDDDHHQLLSNAAKMWQRPIANFVKWSAIQAAAIMMREAQPDESESMRD